jgi:hypothetical protein
MHYMYDMIWHNLHHVQDYKRSAEWTSLEKRNKICIQITSAPESSLQISIRNLIVLLCTHNFGWKTQLDETWDTYLNP